MWGPFQGEEFVVVVVVFFFPLFQLTFRATGIDLISLSSYLLFFLVLLSFILLSFVKSFFLCQNPVFFCQHSANFSWKIVPQVD